MGQGRSYVIVRQAGANITLRIIYRPPCKNF